MYRKRYNEQLSFKDFYLPFGGKLSGNNLWVKLVKLIPWDKIEEQYMKNFKINKNIGNKKPKI